jgi:hypothetical protein
MQEVDAARNKLILSIPLPRADVSSFVDFPEHRYIECFVQGVSAFGLFVRPANHDAIG